MTRSSRLSTPVVIVAALAALLLVFGSGLAVGSPVARLTKGQIKKVANKVVDTRAPSLSVAHAKTADTAATAATAGRADNLDGLDSSAFAQTCAVGQVAANATWYTPTVPGGDVYVRPNRVGGEAEYVCGGGHLEMTKLAVGNFRIRTSGTTFPSTASYILMINADSRTGTVLTGMATSKLAGPVWDLHVADLAGAATNPYYLDVVLVRQS